LSLKDVTRNIQFFTKKFTCCVVYTFSVRSAVQQAN